MQQAPSPIVKDIVLVGGGHSHVGVIKAFGMQPVPGVRITVICTDAHTPYSGMLPGYIAGHYSYDEVHIDLSRLCVFAGARFIQAEVTGLDRTAQTVLLRDRPPLPYDLVSINIGSTPSVRQVTGAAQHAVPVKPIYQFNQRWLALLERARQHTGDLTIAVVGAGAGGVELCLSMQYRLRQELTRLGRKPTTLHFHLFTAEATILPTHNQGVQRRFAQVLMQRGVHVHTAARVAEITASGVRVATGEWQAADEVMWVTQAGGAAWLQSTGLALDAAGFIQVNTQLQSITDPSVFAAGDVASIAGHPLEKAGVFAVRMAKPLTHNLRQSLGGRPLRAYHPQTRWLALISTGNRYAIASRGALGFAGKWVWRWKDSIDRAFMQRFSQFPPMVPHQAKAAASLQPALAMNTEESQQALSAQAMRCGGCGAKVGPDILARALSSLTPVHNPDVLMGLHTPDDAAVVRVPAGKALVHTVDFFRAFIDDPYVFGKIAANHALGDIYAMGALPHTATAIATVPAGIDRQTQALLTQMMAGAVEVLNAARCSLVGGHTGEGQELALGFAINGLLDIDAQGELQTLWRKSAMQAGDALILTKGLGTGTLLAAHARGLARGRWVQTALASMVQSSQHAAEILQAHGSHACTDVTGFGLVGHLLEMTRASGTDATLVLSAIPVLEGALECVAQGALSSLHSANARVQTALHNAAEWASHPRYPLLFDPQTAGGLLASVPAHQAEACVQALRQAGYPQAAVVGKVLPASDAIAPLVLADAVPTEARQ